MNELSLNEVEALSLKVGRGAGFAWGLAEEIGRGGRAMAERGFPWAEALLALARAAGERRAPPLHFETEVRRERPTNGAAPLCPVRVATRLIDEPSILASGPLRIADVGVPLWIAGLFAASGLADEFEAEWSGGPLAPTADVVISRCPDREAPAPTLRRASADAAILAELAVFAGRVYVPASAGSRAKGARGGRVDDE